MRFEIEQAEIEHLLRFLLNLLDIVQALASIAALEPLLHIENIANEFVILFARIHFQFRRRLLDGTKRFHNQHGMMRHDRASAFAYDRRMRDTFGIANVQMFQTTSLAYS